MYPDLLSATRDLVTILREVLLEMMALEGLW